MRSLQRLLYLLSRTAGDVNAAQNGKLIQHVAKRYVHREEIRLLRKGGLW